MPELRAWYCGHCPLVVDLPQREDDPEVYDYLVAQIGEHRLRHLASDRILGALQGSTDEDLWAMTEDRPIEPPFSVKLTPARPVTNADAGPAVGEAEAIVRGKA